MPSEAPSGTAPLRSDGWFSTLAARLYETPGEASRTVALEGVRGLAVLLVFLVHFHAAFGRLVPPGSVWHGLAVALGTAGHLGVDLFFVLSGYLIYRAVLRRPVPFGTFMRRRVRRIYPVFLVMFALYVALSVLVPSRSKLPESGLVPFLLANLLLLPGVFAIVPVITVAWSLSYEMAFYLGIPVLVAGLGLRERQAWVRCILLAVPVLLVLLVPVPPGLRLGPFLMFLPGMLVAELTSMPRVRAQLGPAGELAAALLLPIACLFVVVYSEGHDHSILPGWPAVAHWLAIGSSFGLLLLFVIGRDGWLGRAFTWRPLRYLGNMSYSYYLSHGLGINVFVALLTRVLPLRELGVPAYWLLLPVCFAATLVPATLLFVLVERPMSLAAPSPGASERAPHAA